MTREEISTLIIELLKYEPKVKGFFTKRLEYHNPETDTSLWLKPLTAIRGKYLFPEKDVVTLSEMRIVKYDKTKKRSPINLFRTIETLIFKDSVMYNHKCKKINLISYGE